MEKKYQELKLQHEKEKEELKNEIKNIKDNLSTQQTNNINNGVVDQSNNINNNTLNIVALGEYGKETIDHITKKEWIETLKKRVKAMPELIHKVYIEHPENRTIYIPNQKEGQALIYQGQTWKIEDLAEVLEHIFMSGHNWIYDFITKNPIEPKLKVDTNNMLDEVDNNQQQRKLCKDRIKLKLVNGNKVVKKHFEDQSGKKLALNC